MASKHHPPLVFLHDLDVVRADLVTALESADASTRPGLREALRIVEGRLTLTDEQQTKEWVRRTLRNADVDPVHDHVRAVKTLREAAPGLGLIAANDLVKAAG